MDVHAHQPEEEFADFTENELLSLIDAGTAGAYSEIYRRYRDDVVARASSPLPPAKARQITDDAFLSVLRSLLNGSADTAEGLRSLVDSTVDEHIAHSTPPHDSYSHDDAFPGGAGAPEAALVSQALSTLPDNWQRILWLGEVERLSPEAVADRLNIKASTIERLAGRARQNLKDEWQRVRPTNSETTADHRSALIPALLTSPIVIERLSATLAQAIPEPAPADADTSTVEAAADTSTAEPSEADTAAGAGAGAAEPAEPAEPAETSFVVGTGADPAGTTSAPAAAEAAGTKADLAAATAAGASTETLGASAGTAGNSAGATEDTNTVEPAILAAFGAHPATAGTLTQTPAPAGFRMPKPVLIPVVAACIGLLGTLVGVAIVPQHGEQTGFRPGSASTGVSPADATSAQGDKRNTSGSPDDTNSGEPGQRSGSGKSKASDSGRDGNDKSPQSPGHDGHRADKGSSAAENPGDDDADNSSNSSRDSPSAGEPGDPAPSDSDKSDPKSPSEPTPSTPDDPESPPEPSPSQPDEPTPTDPPATDPPPSEEPTEPPPPPEEPSPSEPPPSDSGAPSEPEPTQDGSSSAPSASN